MDEGSVGVGVLLACTVVFSVAAHALLRSFVVACLVSTFAAAILFQVLAALHIGYLDPFMLVAFVVSLAVCFALSAAIGGAFRLARRRMRA